MNVKSAAKAEPCKMQGEDRTASLQKASASRDEIALSLT